MHNFFSGQNLLLCDEKVFSSSFRMKEHQKSPSSNKKVFLRRHFFPFVKTMNGACADVVPVLCRCCAGVVPVLCRCCADVVPVLCLCSTGDNIRCWIRASNGFFGCSELERTHKMNFWAVPDSNIGACLWLVLWLRTRRVFCHNNSWNKFIQGSGIRLELVPS